MKVLYVHGDSDYSALTFEQNDKQDITGMFNKAQSEGGVYIDDDTGVEYEAYEFGEVDQRFVDFVHNEIQDYDDGKHSNFYVVHE